MTRLYIDEGRYDKLYKDSARLKGVDRDHLRQDNSKCKIHVDSIVDCVP